MKKHLLFLTLSFFSLPCFSQTRVYFSPDDKPEKALISTLQQAREKIWVAVYALTNKKITQALIDAHNNGVAVQVVSDQSYMLGDKYNKVEMLQENGIDLFLYPETAPGIMHNKFAIIDEQVWTGSMNWTVSGNRRNQENCILTDQKEVVERYARQFTELKARCFLQKKQKKKQSTFNALQKGLNGLLSSLQSRFTPST